MESNKELESLKNGDIISAESGSDCAELFHFNADSLNEWATGFKIKFNGLTVFSSKNYKPAKKKFETIIQKHSLTLQK